MHVAQDGRLNLLARKNASVSNLTAQNIVAVYYSMELLIPKG